MILFLTVFLLGLRHGIDFDHIAAISDMSGLSKKKYLFGTLYIIGHASMIIILGLLAILLGAHLPSSLDIIMKKVVGITLIVLGLVLLPSLIRGEDVQLRSRWTILFSGLRSAYHQLIHILGHNHKLPQTSKEYTKPMAFSVGLLHGIGAETPTQLALFITIGGLNRIQGISFLVVFVFGLVLANTLVLLLLEKVIHRFYRIVSVITVVFSIIVGILFIK